MNQRRPSGWGELRRRQPHPAVPALLSLILLAGPALAAQEPAGDEESDTIAAVRRADFVYSVAKFVTWPLSGLEGRSIRLCTMGADPLGGAAARIQGRLIHGRSLETAAVQDLAEIPGCNILYLGPDQAERLDAICAVAAEHSVLTVAATEGFAERCVMINMRPTTRRFSFEVNHRSAVRARLKVSSELLKLGEIVSGPLLGQD